MTKATASKRPAGTAAALAGSMLLVLALAACSSKPTGGGSTPTGGATASSPAGAPAAATVEVNPDPATIGVFAPATVSVKVGDTVKWAFKDANPHTVTADDNSFTSPASGLANGQSFSHTFTSAGSFPYHCAIHPQMKATVIVQ